MIGLAPRHVVACAAAILVVVLLAVDVTGQPRWVGEIVYDPFPIEFSRDMGRRFRPENCAVRTPRATMSVALLGARRIVVYQFDGDWSSFDAVKGYGYAHLEDSAGCEWWGRYLGPDRSKWFVWP